MATRWKHIPILKTLASYRHCLDRLRAKWPDFLQRRHERLADQERHGIAAEKMGEARQTGNG